MPMASANARPRIMLVWITGCASGLRPSASIAPRTRLPMAMAGPNAPNPIAIPAPMYLIPASLMANFVAPASCWATSRAPSSTGGIRARSVSMYYLLAPNLLLLALGFRDHRPSLLLMLLLIRMRLPVGNRHHAEHQGKRGEDERLDDPHEHLQAVESDSQDQRRQEREHKDHHLAGEHIAEETEGEAHQPHQLRYQLQYADESIDRSLEDLPEVETEQPPEHAPEVEELPPVAEPNGGDPRGLHGNGGGDGQGQRGVQVGVGAAEQRDQLTHCLTLPLRLLERLFCVRVVLVYRVGTAVALAGEAHPSHGQRAHVRLLHHKPVLLLLDEADGVEHGEQR